MIWHPVTSEQNLIAYQTKKLMNFLNNFDMNFVVIHPNNDLGSLKILNNYKKYKNKKKFHFLKA